MKLWLFQAFRLTIILATIIIAGLITFEKILKFNQVSKPQVNLIPEEIKAGHFVNSYPFHNQFLVTSSPSIVINFDQELTKTEASLYINGKYLEVNQEKSAKSIKILKTMTNVEEGIYLVKYQACFVDNNCSSGQFTFHIESSRGSQFANRTDEEQVELTITQNSPTLSNLFIVKKTSIKWLNQTGDTIEIKSAPRDFNNSYEPLNSPEIKTGESFTVQFPDPGEYLWYLMSNPEIQGRILVG